MCLLAAFHFDRNLNVQRHANMDLRRDTCRMYAYEIMSKKYNLD